MVYLDSFLYIVIASVLRFGLANTVMTASRCKTTDIVCLTVYLSTKVRHRHPAKPHTTRRPLLTSYSWFVASLFLVIIAFVLTLVLDYIFLSDRESGKAP